MFELRRGRCGRSLVAVGQSAYNFHMTLPPDPDALTFTGTYALVDSSDNLP